MISRRLSGMARSLPALSHVHRCALSSCSRNGSVVSLSRGELANLVSRSTRTISRWESLFGFHAKRENARVLRYPFETLVALVASGVTLNLGEAERCGLNPKAIIALASVVAPRPAQRSGAQPTANVVLIAEDEDDRRLIRAWQDQSLGPVLRKIIRGLTETSST